MSYNFICGIKNVLSGAVILLKLYNLTIPVFFFKVKDIANISASEAVNALVIITYNA